MRITAGEFKGRKIEVPEGYRVRPTTGKVKEAMFSMLANDIPGSVVVDLFAGTGNLGLEALSRGAEKCYFVDNSQNSLKYIEKNIELCRAEDRSVVIRGHYLKGLASLSDQADVILMDPPYNKGIPEQAIEAVLEYDALKDDGVLLVEHYSNEKLKDSYGKLKLDRERSYGTIVLSVYRYNL